MNGSWPPEHNPSSPAGQIESVGAAADRLVRLRGRRRQLARWGIVAMAAIVLAVFVLGAVAHH